MILKMTKMKIGGNFPKGQLMKCRQQTTDEKIKELLDLVKIYNAPRNIIPHDAEEILKDIFKFVQTRKTKKYDLSIIQEISKMDLGFTETSRLRDNIILYFKEG